jgi:hypothetical protein
MRSAIIGPSARAQPPTCHHGSREEGLVGNAQPTDAQQHARSKPKTAIGYFTVCLTNARAGIDRSARVIAHLKR